MWNRALVLKHGVLFTVLFFPLYQLSFANAVSSEKKLGLFPEQLISVDQLRQAQLKDKRLVVLDARDKKSYEDQHIQEAVLPRSNDYYEKQRLFEQHVTKKLPDANAALKENMKKYSKDTPIVTYCNSGGCQAGAVLAMQLKRLGFSDVRALQEGIQVWQEKGYPVKTREE